MISRLLRRTETPAPGAKDTDLGTVLLQLRFIDAEQLTQAVYRQNHSVPRPRLGQVCVTLGFLTQQQLDAALRVQEHKRAGRTTEARMEQAASMLEARMLGGAK